MVEAVAGLAFRLASFKSSGGWLHCCIGPLVAHTPSLPSPFCFFRLGALFSRLAWQEFKSSAGALVGLFARILWPFAGARLEMSVRVNSARGLTTYSSRPWGDVAVFSDTLMRHGCSIRR